jgi:hypothetical protein
LRATQASDCPGDAEKVANIKYIKCLGMLKLSLANARSLKRVDGFITAIKGGIHRRGLGKQNEKKMYGMDNNMVRLPWSTMLRSSP